MKNKISDRWYHDRGTCISSFYICDIIHLFQALILFERSQQKLSYNSIASRVCAYIIKYEISKISKRID